jgi:hypothetical protein
MVSGKQVRAGQLISDIKAEFGKLQLIPYCVRSRSIENVGIGYSERRTVVMEVRRKVSGITDDDIHVRAGNYVKIGGIMNGDVTVDKGGAVRITGIFNGEVYNNGGEVIIKGLTA